MPNRTVPSYLLRQHATNHLVFQGVEHLPLQCSPPISDSAHRRTSQTASRRIRRWWHSHSTACQYIWVTRQHQMRPIDQQREMFLGLNVYIVSSAPVKSDAVKLFPSPENLGSPCGRPRWFLWPELSTHGIPASLLPLLVRCQCLCHPWTDSWPSWPCPLSMLSCCLGSQ